MSNISNSTLNSTNTNHLVSIPSNDKHLLAKHAVAGIVTLALSILFIPVTFGVSLIAGTVISYCIYKNYCKQTQKVQDTARKQLSIQEECNPLPQIKRESKEIITPITNPIKIENANDKAYYYENSEHVLVIGAFDKFSEEIIAHVSKFLPPFFKAMENQIQEGVEPNLAMSKAFFSIITETISPDYPNICIFASRFDKKQTNSQIATFINNKSHRFDHNEQIYKKFMEIEKTPEKKVEHLFNIGKAVKTREEEMAALEKEKAE